VTAEDASLFADWMAAFAAEAVPHDPPPVRERLERTAGEGRHLFWIVNGEPVSVAGIGRRTRNAVAISGVYTPAPLRGRGYAGSVTAAVVERVCGGRDDRLPLHRPGKPVLEPLLRQNRVQAGVRVAELYEARDGRRVARGRSLRGAQATKKQSRTAPQPGLLASLAMTAHLPVIARSARDEAIQMRPRCPGLLRLRLAMTEHRLRRHAPLPIRRPSASNR
jgi:hypothetical protein